MKRHKNFNLLLMLVLLVAVGQMAQTIYIPAIADMAVALNVREGAVQSVMAAYLLTYGISQLFYGPLSDRVGRRPVILVGMSIFMLATLVAITTHSLPVLIAASAMQGMGTGVGGVMARTLPRDLYEGAQLRHANSLLNMGILVSPLIAPLLGGILDTLWSWRACYAFLLVLCAGVTFSMAKWMPETRPEGAPRTKLLASYKTLFGTGAFNCYLLMLIGGLAGIAVFEACSGVLMGAVLGLSSMAVSILFILPIPDDVDPRAAGHHDRLDPAGACGAVLLRRRDVVPAGHQRRDGAVPVPRRNRRGAGGRLAEYRLRRAGLAVGDDAANRSGQPRPADDADGPVDSAVLAAAGLALHPPSAAGISAAVIHRMAADALSGLPDWSSAGPRKRSAVILPGGGSRLTRPP